MLVIDLVLACYGSRVGVIIIDERGVVLELARWNWGSISWARLSWCGLVSWGVGRNRDTGRQALTTLSHSGPFRT